MIFSFELFGRESLVTILEHQDEAQGNKDTRKAEKGAYFESKTYENDVLCHFRVQKQFQKATRPQLFRISEREKASKEMEHYFASELTRSFSVQRTYKVLSISKTLSTPCVG